MAYNLLSRTVTLSALRAVLTLLTFSQVSRSVSYLSTEFNCDFPSYPPITYMYWPKLATPAPERLYFIDDTIVHSSFSGW